MRLSKVEIRNILGLEELEFQPGALTVISGGNDEGKSTIIESIKAALGGGHDATLLRRGAEVGEVVLVMDTGDVERTRITEKSTTRTWKGPDGVPKGKPQSIIDELLNSLSFNPVAFLMAPPDKQAEWLLEMLPIVLDAGALSDMTGLQIDPAEITGKPLDVLARIRKRIYDLRTGVNRVVQEKKKTAAGLQATIADVSDPDGIARDLAAAEEDVNGKREELAKVLRTIDQQADAARTKARSTRQVAIEEGVKQVATLRERQKAAHNAAMAKEMVTQFKEQEKEAVEESETLTARLEALDKFKESCLDTIPIKGMKYVDGRLLLNEVNFERVNRAKQVRVIFQFAKITAGPLGLVIVDNLECLDREAFEEFSQIAPKTGLQFIVTRVTKGPLFIGDSLPCQHERLNEDGICRECGADCRGIS